MLRDLVLKEMQEYDFNSTRDYEVSDEKKQGSYIHFNECIFFVDENEKNVSVAFDVATLPDVAARITTILYGIKQIESISIMDNYFVRDGKFFSGENAIISFRSYLAERENNLNNLMQNLKFFNA